MKHYTLYILLLVSCLQVYGQENKKFDVNFSGYVKTDVFYDSRNSLSVREGQFLLWPKPIDLDSYGNDLNAVSSFNFLSVQSRMKSEIKGPTVFGADASAVIEVDFFGQAEGNIALLRLRHAYSLLNWEKANLYIGQYWNPFFIGACFPGTISFSTGTPFSTIARNPQIRFQYKLGSIKIESAVLSQRDFSTWGEFGSSSSYLRTSLVPDLYFQMHYAKEDDLSAKYYLGAGLAFKTVVPRTESTVMDEVYSVDENVSGLSFQTYSKVSFRPITAKIMLRYGENISDLLAISGFAVQDIINISTGERSYTPLRGFSAWADIHSNGKVQVGLFGGFFSNLGSKDILSSRDNSVFGLGTNIHQLLRLSPRLTLDYNNVRIAFEAEYNRASYGNDFDENYLPSTIENIDMLRGLLAFYYFFK